MAPSVQDQTWSNAGTLLVGEQGQQKLLQPLAFPNSKLVQLNPHLISAQNANDRAHADNRPRAGGQVHSDADGRTRWEGAVSLDQHAAQTDVDRFSFQFIRTVSQADLGLNGNAAGAAFFLFRTSLGGPNQLPQTILVNGLVKKKTCAGFKTHGHGAGALIITDQDDGCCPVPSRTTHLAGQLDSVGSGHMQVQEDHIEFSSAEKAGSVGALCES